MWILAKIISWMIFISPVYRGYKIFSSVKYYLSWLLWLVGCIKKNQKNEQEELEKKLLNERRRNI